MAEGKPIKIKINGDASGLQRTLKTAGGSLQKFGKAAMLGVGAGVAGVGAALFKAGQASEVMTKAIVAGTGATGEALAGLEEDAKRTLGSVPDSAEAVGNALAEVNTRLGLTGEELSDTTEGFLDFARLTGTDAVDAIAMVDKSMELFGETTSSTDEVMGDMLRISQATGVGMDVLGVRLGKLGGTFSAMGLNLEESTALLGAMEAAGVDLRKAGAGVEYFTDQMLAAGKDPRTEWDKLQKEIMGAKDSTEAARIATEALGPSGLAMYEAIQSGQLDYNSLLGEGAGLVEEQTAASETMGEKFAEIGNKITTLLMPVAEALFDGISAALDQVLPLIEELSTAFSEEGLAGALRVLREKLQPVEDWMKRNKPIMAAIAVVIGALIVGAIWALVAAFIALLSPVVLIIAGVAAFAAGLVWLYENVEIVGTVVDAVFGWLRDNVPPIIETVIEFVTRFIGIWWDVQVAIFKVFQFIAETIAGIVEFFVNLAVDVVTAAGDLFGFLRDKITEAKDWVGDRISDIVTFFTELPGRIADTATAIFNAFLDIGKKIIDGIVDGIKAAPGAIVDAIEGLIPGGGIVGGAISAIGGLFADGGIVTRPTLAMVGEAGPEMIIPMKTGSKMLGAKSLPNGMGGSGGVVVNVTSNADPYTIGREVAWAAAHSGL